MIVKVIAAEIPSWFVHRAGRSARCGKEGNNLLFLTPEETAYIEFIEKYEKVSLTKMEANLKGNDDGAEQIRQQIVEMASKERYICFFFFFYLNCFNYSNYLSQSLDCVRKSFAYLKNSSIYLPTIDKKLLRYE